MGLMTAREAADDTESLSSLPLLSCQNTNNNPGIVISSGPQPLLSGQRQWSSQQHHLLGPERLVGHSYNNVNRFLDTEKT